MFRKLKDDLGNEESRLSGFTMGRVFSDKDLVDNPDKPIPTVFVPMPDTAQELYDYLVPRITKASGYEFREVCLLYSGAKGECNYVAKRISILTDMDSQMKCLISIHEFIHALFHGEKAVGVSTKRREFECQSVTYVIGSILGLQDSFSVSYLQAWGGTASELKQSLSRIHEMSKQAIEQLGLLAEAG
jgi:hypothetical protein